jgi:glycosyltransferase involved in cell wall biosynthesis
MSGNKILVVAISPPPYGGQALMVQAMLNANFRSVQLYHVRMAFSDSMASVGKVDIRKICHMIYIVYASLVKRFRYKIGMIYYVPGGSGMAPVVRDIFILFFLRPFFRKIIFHFHAAGVSEVVENLPTFLKFLARQLYNKPDLSIYLSARNPDKQYFVSKQCMIIANGLEDVAVQYVQPDKTRKNEVKLLFVGVLQESKGVRILLESLAILVKEGLPVEATLVGEFSSTKFEEEMHEFCKKKGIESLVNFVGVQVGEDKWRYFADADIFCFPSFFEAESFGNVVVEAMMFNLPVIATHWRGIPDIVDDEKTGLLVPVKDSNAFAQAIVRLVLNSELRNSMGKKGREKYLQKYQLSTFIQGMEDAFNLVLKE